MFPVKYSIFCLLFLALQVLCCRRVYLVAGNRQNSKGISPQENARIPVRSCYRRRRLYLLFELPKNCLTFISTGF